MNLHHFIFVGCVSVSLNSPAVASSLACFHQAEEKKKCIAGFVPLSQQSSNAFIWSVGRFISQCSCREETAWPWLTLLFVCFSQPPVAKKDPSAVSMAHMLKRSESKTESHTNGSEVLPNIMNVSPQVNKRCGQTLFYCHLQNVAVNSHTCCRWVRKKKYLVMAPKFKSASDFYLTWSLLQTVF